MIDITILEVRDEYQNGFTIRVSEMEHRTSHYDERKFNSQLMSRMEGRLKGCMQGGHAQWFFKRRCAPVSQERAMSCKVVRIARCQAAKTASAAKEHVTQKSKTQRMFELIEERRASGDQGLLSLQAADSLVSCFMYRKVPTP